ncbi:MAG: nucleotidyltransferase family protein [Thermoanaerobaculia bacterium]
MTVAGVLLAAGTSRRIGRPKALLPYRGTTLVQHAARTLCATACQPRIVVVSPEIEKSCRLRDEVDVALVVNPDPLRGLSSSLHAAMSAIEAHEDEAGALVEGILITLVDQPLITPEHLNAVLAAGAETGLAATSWPAAFGPPTFLYRSFFPSLRQLRGDEGAKKILRAAPARLRLVEFPGAALDVDDPASYERLLSGAKA